MDQPFQRPVPWLVALHQPALAEGDVRPEQARLLAGQMGGNRPEQPWKGYPLVSDADRLSERDKITSATVGLIGGPLNPVVFTMIQHWSDPVEIGGEAPVELPHRFGEARERVRGWLDGLVPQAPAVASFLAQALAMGTMIPHDVQLVALRLRCLSTLADPQEAAER